MTDNDFLNDIMGFNPSDMSVFHEQPTGGDVNSNIYKVNPVKLSKSEDGHYHSKIRIIYNPFDVKESIVKNVKYSMYDQDGFFQADSKLSLNNRNCPIFMAWKKLHFSKNEEEQKWANEMFDKSETKWVPVQIIEDENQPELVGQFKVWKLPFSVWEKMDAKMNPSADSKKSPVPLMDYLFGPVLELDVAPGPDDPKAPDRKQREISYTLCEFESDATPIIKIDGTQLFEDSELEAIEEFSTLKNQFAKAKTEKAKKEKQAEMDEKAPEIKNLYKKAIAYLKENCLNIVDECGYHEWDDTLTKRVQRWIDTVLQMKDPKATLVTEDKKEEEPTDKKTTKSTKKEKTDNVFEEAMAEDSNDDLPF